ncbi:MAG TPA: hypothetical protein VJL89_11160, partial [Thermodesulfovibrionia bacterium]|nr:hypothetical protein [Thermodesulfovibrionia bacterium]
MTNQTVSLRIKQLFSLSISVKFITLILILTMLPWLEADAQEIGADVAVVVDTSASMRNEGMDPERTSLLVTKLLADIVPGELSVIRLPDVNKDKAILPGKSTGKMQPCPEDPTKQCNLIEMDPNVTWEDVEKKVRQEKFGALFRSTRGDPEFKNQLPAHLEQEANNSLFSLAFRSAQGIFDEHQSKGMKLPRMMIWLSDGKADNQNEEARIKRIISELAADNVAVEAVVFGKGDTRLAKEAGIDVRKTSNPAELMETFAAVFRRIVGAPYGIDNSVSEKPQFQMMQHIEKAWIVVYG